MKSLKTTLSGLLVAASLFLKFSSGQPVSLQDILLVGGATTGLVAAGDHKDADK
jgi:hypothetical protein